MARVVIHESVSIIAARTLSQKLSKPTLASNSYFSAMRRTLLIVSIAAAISANAANWPEHPVLHAVRVNGPSPVIDGDLSDAAWQKAPEFTDFTQHDPDDGKPPTMRTQRPHRLRRQRHLLRREDDRSAAADRASSRAATPSADSTSSPSTSIRSTTASPATPSPSRRPDEQGDTVLYNDIGEDPSWDGVWESAMKIVPDGWMAEVRVPVLAAAVSGQAGPGVGHQHHAATVRNNEIVASSTRRKGETGFVSHFADIDGIEGIHRGRPLEIVPYTVARTDFRTRIQRTTRCCSAPTTSARRRRRSEVRR